MHRRERYRSGAERHEGVGALRGARRPGGIRVGIDGGCWLNRRGYGRYARGVLNALARRGDADRYVLFADPETAAAPDLPAAFETVVIAAHDPPSRAAAARGRRRLRDLWRFSRALAAERLDVLFFPSVYTFVPLLRPVPAVVTIHDVIAERHPGLVFPGWRQALLWRAKVAMAIRQARAILTVSEPAREGIVRELGVPPERVHVVLEAPDPVFRPLDPAPDLADVLPGRGLPRGARFLLYVGGLSPHKNLELLLDAYGQLAGDPRFADLRLVLVGDLTGDVFYSAHEPLRARVASDGLQDRVCFAGYVPDSALAALYNRAEVLVLPSVEEGFGLPAVEAAACGAPVVVSAAGPMASLLGPGALAFAPGDVGALLGALRTVLADPGRRRAMGVEARRRAAQLSWDRSAAEIHALLHAVAGNSVAAS